MPEEEIENVERVRTRGLYEHRRGREDGVRKIRKAWKTSYRNNGE